MFWDEKVLERALYIAFGVDQKDAERADELRRESEKADSLARNANWQATELRKKLEELQKALGGKSVAEEYQDLRAEHERLVERARQFEKRAQAAENALKDTNLKISDLSARHASFRAEYELEFSKRFQTQSAVEQSPVVAMSLAGNKCEVCGTEGPSVSAVIQKKLNSHQCPMCEQPITPAKAKDVKSIQALDQKISVIRASLADTVKQRERLQKELTDAQLKWNDARTAAIEFEEENAAALEAFMRSTQLDNVEATIKRYRSQIDEALERNGLNTTKGTNAEKSWQLFRGD